MNKGFIDGHIEPTVDFDYDAVDARLAGGNAKEPARSEEELVAAARLLHHIVVIGGTNPRETMLWVNVFLFVMGIHPNQGASGQLIAEGLKVSKDEWFRRVSRMRRILGARGLFLPEITGQWGEAGRNSSANAAVRFWQRRGGQPMIKINEADKKLNWIADNLKRLKLSEMPPLARQELKAKLLPVLKIYNEL